MHSRDFHLGRVMMAAAVLGILSATLYAQEKDPAMDPIVRAPDFPKDFAWLNTDKPLSFEKELKGQVVLLDFWTYCCINCMHVIPDLEYLEQKYKDQPFTVIGVHSAKYDNETDAANIRAAVQRYQVHHPVLVDQRRKVWESYDVTAWPTTVVVGSDGKIIGAISGENHRELLDKVIAKALVDGKANGTLAKEPLKLAKEGQVKAASGLSFPGKVIADAAARRLFIVDSNHHRIVMTSYPGEDGHITVREVIGSGKVGAADGDYAAASFNRPQGGTLSPGGNVLWIADTENHLVRRVDLEKKVVTTVLGTGKQLFDPEAGKTGRAQPLNSPWDLAISGNRLYIAQAGQHQIFAMNLMTTAAEVAAGTARENLRDAQAKEANLAQPSGMVIDPKTQQLYFADSEVSAIRAVDLKEDYVYTLIGEGLFDFGDTDGDFPTARLQHPLDVAISADGTRIFVADTYNHKIKVIDLEKKKIQTLAGTGKPGTGAMGEKVQFFEPASVAVGGPHELFVTDTNNHRIVRIDPENGAWKELVIEGLSEPGIVEPMVSKDAKQLGEQKLAPGKPVVLDFSLTLPPGNHLTVGAPLSLKVTDGTKTIYSASLSAGTGSTVSGKLPAETFADKPSQVHVMLYYTHCSDGPSAVCTPAECAWTFKAAYGDGGAEKMSLEK